MSNSTIAYSAGDGVYISGASGRVTNCVIHDVDLQRRRLRRDPHLRGQRHHRPQHGLQRRPLAASAHSASGRRSLYNTSTT